MGPECNLKRSVEWLNKVPMDCCVKSGEVALGVRVTGKNTELVKIISTIASTNDVGHFEIIIYSITLFLAAVSLILVCFIMAVLLYNIYRVLKILGFCVVLFVASIPIAIQVVCTSTVALSCFGRETSHCVSVGVHRGTFWNGHVVLQQDGHAHTEHHDYRVEASVV